MAWLVAADAVAIACMEYRVTKVLGDTHFFDLKMIFAP